MQKHFKTDFWYIKTLFDKGYLNKNVLDLTLIFMFQFFYFRLFNNRITFKKESFLVNL